MHKLFAQYTIIILTIHKNNSQFKARSLLTMPKIASRTNRIQKPNHPPSKSKLIINPITIQRGKKTVLIYPALSPCNLQSMVFFPQPGSRLVYTPTCTQREGFCAQFWLNVPHIASIMRGKRPAPCFSPQFARINAAFVLRWPAECTVEMGLFRVRACTHTTPYVYVPLQSTK